MSLHEAQIKHSLSGLWPDSIQSGLSKSTFWMVFFLILSWPGPKSHQAGARQSSRKPPTFPAQSFQTSFRDTKATSLLFPRVFKQLSTRADSEEPQAQQQRETVIHEANQIIGHLGSRAEEKRLRNTCLFAKVGSKTTTNLSPRFHKVTHWSKR